MMLFRPCVFYTSIDGNAVNSCRQARGQISCFFLFSVSLVARDAFRVDETFFFVAYKLSKK